MAREDYQKKLVGYALSTNSLLDRMVDISESTYAAVEQVHNVVIKGMSVSEKIADAIQEQTKVLTEIRDILRDPAKAAKSAGGPKLNKLEQAGGIVALMGLGLVTFIGAFKMAGTVGPSEIASAIAVSLAVVPVSMAFARVIEEIPSSLVMNPALMAKTMLAMVALATGYAMIALAIRLTPSISGSQLMNSIAVAGVFYIVGSVFAKLLEAMTNQGLFGFFMNRNRVQQTMGSMVIMALSLVVIGFAITAMPNISLAKAGAFAIASLALIPLAIAFKQLKWVFVLSRKFKIQDVAKTTVMLGIVALALIPVGLAARLVQPVSPEVAKTLFMLALIMIPLSIITSLVINAIQGGGNKAVMDKVLGPAAPKEKKKKTYPKPMDIVKWVGVSIAVVGAIALIAWTISKAAPMMIEGLNATRKLDMIGMLKLLFTIGVAGLIVASIVSIMKGKNKSSSGFLGMGGSSSSQTGKMSVNDMVVGALALPVVALGLVATAWIFNLLPDSFKEVPPMWGLTSALALLAFSVPFMLISKLVPKIGMKNMFMGLIAVAVLSLAILSVAYALSILPDKYVPIPIGWAISSAIALTVFAIPVTVIGMIATSGIGGVGILLGVVGMIVIAAGMLAVAWILSYIPADKLATVAKGLTEALLAPINGIVDVFKRLKEEIGIDNLLPLAGGIIALSVAMIAMSGAVAGVAAGGLFSAIAGVGKAFFNSVAEFFGGEREKGPLETLLALADNHQKIKGLAQPITKIADGMYRIAGISADSITKINAFLKNLNDFSFDKQADALSRIATSYVTISSASKAMNIEAIQKTTDMIKALAYLSEVGGETAVDRLGDKLILAIQELANMIANFEDTVREQGDVGSRNTESLGGTISGLKDSLSGFISGALGSSTGSGGSRDSGATIDTDEMIEVLERILRHLQNGTIKTVNS